MKNKDFTSEQVTNANEVFKLHIGRVVAQWSFVESGLSAWFQRITQMHPLVARKIFYSATGFDARKRMLLAAINTISTQPDISEYLRAITNKAGNYAATRNMVVHSDVVFIGNTQSKFFGQTILLQGRQEWATEVPDSEVLTQPQLEFAEENFGRLGAVIALGLDWKGNGPSPLEYLPLVQGLPNPAHSGRLDQTVLDNASLVQEGQVNWHR